MNVLLVIFPLLKSTSLCYWVNPEVIIVIVTTVILGLCQALISLGLGKTDDPLEASDKGRGIFYFQLERGERIIIIYLHICKWCC